MKIFITGATGFIGSNLARYLAEKGHDVVAGGRSFEKVKPFLNKVKTARIDLENKDTLSEALRRHRPDFVYHGAALVESNNPALLRRVNVAGTRNVFEACLEEGVKRVIYISTIAVVSGNPDVPLTENLPYRAKTAYGLSKAEAEKIALGYRKKGLKVAVIRPCMVYGENEPHALRRLVNAVKRRIIPVIGSGGSKLQLLSVENLVDILALCLTREEAYEGIYYAADKEALTIKEILEYIAGVLNARPPLSVPEFILPILSVFPLTRRYADFFLKDRLYSIERLREKLGYVPRVSVYEGLRRAVLSYK